MKTNFFKPLAGMAFVAFTAFSCAGTNEVSDNRDMEPTDVTVTETEVAAGTTEDGTTVVVAETDVVADTTIMTPTTDPMANTDMDYSELFEDIDNTEQYSALQLARMNPQFSTFVRLVDQAGLAASFEMAGPITVFLPTNEAFDEMPREDYQRITNPANTTELIEIIQAHVLNGEVSTAQFEGRQVLEYGEGRQIPVYTEGGGVGGMGRGATTTVGGAEIVRSDIETSNGIVHVVNGVITPQDATGGTIMDR